MRLLIALALILLMGCARVRVHEEMQADQSYKIEVNGNGFTLLEEARSEAYRRAGLLCPNRFVKKAEIPDDSVKPHVVLIVKCHEPQDGKTPTPSQE